MSIKLFKINIFLLSLTQTFYGWLSRALYVEVVIYILETTISGRAYELERPSGAELMRTRYCIRHELGICPIHQKGSRNNLPASLRDIRPDTKLFLLNNGRRLALHFDCRACEMTVCETAL